MKVYFYHTQDIQYILGRMENGEFPPHYLYGATKLKDYGIDVIWHKARLGLPRWRMMLRNAWLILTCREHYDALYATHYRGLEIIVLLRALGLYRKPVVIWHHQPVITSGSRWREWLGRLFYRGFDRMFFFSQKLIDDSLRSHKARADRLLLGHWGADLDFYDRVRMMADERHGFISTGKEMRDMPTLIKAFNAAGAPLDIYLNRSNGGFSYEALLSTLDVGQNVQVHFVDGLVPFELARKVSGAACVVICCLETKYTVGLTTVVEAMALGLPVICSRNPQIPIDFDREGCGISVPYGDVEGWKRAIGYMQSHPEEARRMGERGRRLAEELYNDRRCAQEVAETLLSLRQDESD
jgi:glycosyltransferase involved in cell wall biosynthesis